MTDVNKVYTVNFVYILTTPYFIMGYGKQA